MSIQSFPSPSSLVPGPPVRAGELVALLDAVAGFTGGVTSSNQWTMMDLAQCLRDGLGGAPGWDTFRLADWAAVTASAWAVEVRALSCSDRVRPPRLNGAGRCWLGCGERDCTSDACVEEWLNTSWEVCPVCDGAVNDYVTFDKCTSCDFGLQVVEPSISAEVIDLPGPDAEPMGEVVPIRKAVAG